MSTLVKKDLGFSLVEVLVTLVILMTGLLGLAGLQGRAFSSQVESYQRSQALILLKDMANRLNANRQDATNYVTSTPLGVGAAACATGGSTTETDKCEWSNALQGSAEGTSGAMVGARGCIYRISTGLPEKYLIAVVWQGLTPTAASPAVTCGQNSYGSNDALRRVMTIPVTKANLL